MPSTPRVFFVNRYFHPDESATAQLLADLAFGLAAKGFEIHIVCSRLLYDEPNARLPARDSIRGVAVHRLWTTRFGRRRLPGRACDYLSFYLSSAVFLLARLRRADIVVAQTDPPLISLVAAAAARLRRATLLNWLQDVFPEVASRLGANPLPAWLDACLRSLRDASLRTAAVNIVLGGRMAEYLGTRRIPADRIEIIENWADTEAVTAKPAAASSLRAALELGAEFVVAYSGNLGRAHDYRTIQGAAAALRDEPGIVFLMIGGGANMQSFAAHAAEARLGNVRFLPYQPRERLGDSLAAADVHLVNLLPALEGLIVPSKFYGILAAGRPIVFIGDPEGELARAVRAAQCGFAVGMGRSDELVRAIETLRGDARLRLAMGAASRRLAECAHSAAASCDRWEALLRRMAAAQRHRAPRVV
jgi:glycosyltransferase involved in cell wall biosynthesis